MVVVGAGSGATTGHSAARAPPDSGCSCSRDSVHTARTTRRREGEMGEGGLLALLGRFPVARLSLTLFTVYQPLKTSCCSAVVQCDATGLTKRQMFIGAGSRSTARLPLRDGRATVSLVFGAYVLSRDSKTVATDRRDRSIGGVLLLYRKEREA